MLVPKTAFVVLTNRIGSFSDNLHVVEQQVQVMLDQRRNFPFPVQPQYPIDMLAEAKTLRHDRQTFGLRLLASMRRGTSLGMPSL